MLVLWKTIKLNIEFKETYQSNSPDGKESSPLSIQCFYFLEITINFVFSVTFASKTC